MNIYIELYKAAFDIEVNPFSIVIADRGYCDYSLLNH